jgi:hypothetical protein
MKNLHLIPTDKPSRLWFNDLIDGSELILSLTEVESGNNQHIYITSDKEIKEGDWCLDIVSNYLYKAGITPETSYPSQKKIILTTDQDLIGVQAIDDEFLEWFVKNPSCEEVEVEKGYRGVDLFNYKIIIPKEEPKQETLEEVAERLLRDHRDFEVEGHSPYQNGRLNGILEGLKYQSERMYSKKEVLTIIKAFDKDFYQGIVEKNGHTNKWFEQFKKK